MELVYPRIEHEVVTKTYGRFVVSPLEHGFGTTVGNSLRRVLISSLSGAAVTSVRVTGIHHEFSPIPGAMEDMTQLILNLKQLRIKSYSKEPIRIRLIARGEGLVTAADLQVPSELELMNPELELLTLDSDESEVEMEMTVQSGRGYSPADERGRLPIDEIPVDAIFSPIRRVRFDVSRERFDVGRERGGTGLDYDRLVLHIWTDGTIDPEDALSQASAVLVRHFNITATLGEMPEMTFALPSDQEEGVPTAVADRPIDDLGLQVRAYNCLKRAGISTMGEVIERLHQGRDEVLAIRNFGEKSLEELLEAMVEKGFGAYLEGTEFDPNAAEDLAEAAEE